MEILKRRHEVFLKAFQTLKQSIDKIENETFVDYFESRDSMIQRFEYCCDIFWKLLKDYLYFVEKVKDLKASPKAVFRSSVEVGVLTQEEYKICIEMIEDRNITSHGYYKELAERISQKIPRYYSLMDNVEIKLTRFLKEFGA